MSARRSTGAPLDLLGRHVLELALEDPVARGLNPTCGLRHTEVDDPRHTVGVDQYVLRRHVAMHDAEQVATLALGFMRRVQPLQHASHDGERDLRRDAPSLGLRRSHQPRERLACHIIHHQEKLPVHGNHVESGNHVRVTDARGEVGFVEEHLDELLVLGETLRVEALDGDRAGESRFAEEASQVHGGHAARRDLAVDRIATDDPRGKRWRWCGAHGRADCIQFDRGPGEIQRCPGPRGARRRCAHILRLPSDSIIRAERALCSWPLLEVIEAVVRVASFLHTAQHLRPVLVRD